MFTKATYVRNRTFHNHHSKRAEGLASLLIIFAVVVVAFLAFVYYQQNGSSAKLNLPDVSLTPAYWQRTGWPITGPKDSIGDSDSTSFTVTVHNDSQNQSSQYANLIVTAIIDPQISGISIAPSSQPVSDLIYHGTSNSMQFNILTAGAAAHGDYTIEIKVSYEGTVVAQENATLTVS